ncbi:hypothetical protein CLCR_02874 [Cladophialophora carrionii]|uniref:Uncharacterized protein n=1 Tax=Cladophialophora carrionii TaxID=86049 RepID=A0A1C1D1R8_9EURO|nr:hypothetical protein CLCR_02874 [Cladophialophora carrionii]
MSSKSQAGSNAAKGSSRASRLSPARLARKRKSDRESQKASRLKQKNYIAHLEALVQSLGPTAGSNPISLLKQKGAENVEIRKALASISKIAQTALDMTDGGCSGSSISPDPVTECGEGKSMDLDTSKVEKSDTAGNTHSVFIASGRQSVPVGNVPGADDLEALGAAPSSDAHEIPLAFSDDEGAYLEDYIHHNVLDFSMQGPVFKDTLDPSSLSSVKQVPPKDQPHLGFSNPGLFSETLALRPQHGSNGRDWLSTVNLLSTPVTFPLETPDDANDGDIPVSAVLYGWDAVNARRPLDAGWKVLRQFDQNIFVSCGIAERLAALRIMRLMCHHINTGERRPELPAFMLKRPCQEHIKHHPMIDYLVWPGLRERLIFSQAQFAADADRYAELFRTNIRFLWPFEPEDIYFRDPSTGRYSFSEQFVGRVEDLSCWTMDNDYFVALPELLGDIPRFSPSPSYGLSHHAPTAQRAFQGRAPREPDNGREHSEVDRGFLIPSFSQALWGTV